jgi:hypothetical protein
MMLLLVLIVAAAAAVRLALLKKCLNPLGWSFVNRFFLTTSCSSLQFRVPFLPFSSPHTKKMWREVNVSEHTSVSSSLLFLCCCHLLCFPEPAAAAAAARHRSVSQKAGLLSSFQQPRKLFVHRWLVQKQLASYDLLLYANIANMKWTRARMCLPAFSNRSWSKLSFLHYRFGWKKKEERKMLGGFCPFFKVKLW